MVQHIVNIKKKSLNILVEENITYLIIVEDAYLQTDDGHQSSA